jgi:hypothetical protein
MSITELANEVGISRQALHGYKQRGCPMTTADEVNAWRANNILPRNGVAVDGESQGARLIRMQADKAAADAEGKRIRNQQLRGELVERAEVIREFAEFLVAAKPILDAIPDDISTESPLELRGKMHGIAKRAVDRALLKLSQWQPSGQIVIDDEPADEPPPF